MLYVFINIHLNYIEIQTCVLTHSSVPFSGSMVDLMFPFVRKPHRPLQNLGQTLHYCYFPKPFLKLLLNQEKTTTEAHVAKHNQVIDKQPIVIGV